MDRGEEYYLCYLNGDESGFDRLIELYRENLIFFLMRYLPTGEDAEDAAEDAFVSLLLHPYRPGRGASLKTYLFTLGRNRALNLLKKNRRQAPLECSSQFPIADELALEDRLCRDDARRQLLHALDSLPADYREVLYLLYFEELSPGEVAKVMKKTKKQIENLSYRGRQALKEKLGKEFSL